MRRTLDAMLPPWLRSVGGYVWLCRKISFLTAIIPNGPRCVLPAAPDAARRDEDGIVGVVSHDLIQVARAERPGVVGEDFLRRACHLFSFEASTPSLP
jgi:hypothetical protein